MTQKEKDLLLKDLCARLPYGVKLKCRSKKMICIGNWTLDTITLDRIFNEDTKYVPFDEFPPYLFPLSSMTDEQNLEYLRTCKGGNAGVPTLASFEWLNKNHFDYRGLIKKGLAIDATGLNIY